MPYGSIGERGYFILYSLYKHFPIPDGALLVFKSKFNISNFEKCEKNLNNYNNQSRSDLIIENRNIFIFKWLIKRFLQTTFNINKNYFKERPNQKKIPLIEIIHHPITKDYRYEIQFSKGSIQKISKWRWFSFLKMQKRV